MIRIGIIGTGGMGKVHLSNYAHLDDCKVTALCDKSQESKTLAEERGIKHYSDLAEMLENEQIDVLDICTPTFLHKEQVLAGLNAGLHVICEKPLALKLADGKEIYETAEKAGKLLFVGQVLQFAPQTEVLREIISKKKYGNVLDASFLRLAAAPGWVSGGWLFDKNKSGLLPFDLHIHDLDLIVSLFGKPESFEAYGIGRAEAEYKEHYRFIYKYSGFNIQAEAAWYHANFPFTAQWRIYCKNAVLEGKDGGVTAYPYGEEPVKYDTEEKILIPTGINLPPTGMFYNELGFFLEEIKNGRTEQYRKNEILSVLEILESIES